MKSPIERSTSLTMKQPGVDTNNSASAMPAADDGDNANDEGNSKGYAGDDNSAIEFVMICPRPIPQTPTTAPIPIAAAHPFAAAFQTRATSTPPTVATGEGAVATGATTPTATEATAYPSPYELPPPLVIPGIHLPSRFSPFDLLSFDEVGSIPGSTTDAEVMSTASSVAASSSSSGAYYANVGGNGEENSTTIKRQRLRPHSLTEAHALLDAQQDLNANLSENKERLEQNITELQNQVNALSTYTQQLEAALMEQRLKDSNASLNAVGHCNRSPFVPVFSNYLTTVPTGAAAAAVTSADTAQAAADKKKRKRKE